MFFILLKVNQEWLVTHTKKGVELTVHNSLIYFIYILLELLKVYKLNAN